MPSSRSLTVKTACGNFLSDIIAAAVNTAEARSVTVCTAEPSLSVTVNGEEISFDTGDTEEPSEYVPAVEYTVPEMMLDPEYMKEYINEVSPAQLLQTFVMLRETNDKMAAQIEAKTGKIPDVKPLDRMIRQFSDASLAEPSPPRRARVQRDASKSRRTNTFIVDGKLDETKYREHLESTKRVPRGGTGYYKPIKLGGYISDPIPVPPVNSADIIIELSPVNPKNKNTKAWYRYEQYKHCDRLSDYLAYAITDDYKADWHLGYIKIMNPWY